LLLDDGITINKRKLIVPLSGCIVLSEEHHLLVRLGISKHMRRALKS